jgi:hypothetical protein
MKSNMIENEVCLRIEQILDQSNQITMEKQLETMHGIIQVRFLGGSFGLLKVRYDRIQTTTAAILTFIRATGYRPQVAG